MKNKRQKWHENGVYAVVPTAAASLAASQCLLLMAGLFSACNTTRLIQNLQEVSEVVK